MFPKWHVIWGVVLIIIFKLLIPSANNLDLALIFFASICVDIDHYFNVLSKGNIKIFNEAYRHKCATRKIKHNRKNAPKEFNIFHSIEFQALIGIFSVLFAPFFFIFIGLVFHSMLDVIWMAQNDLLNTREFFLFKRVQTIFF